MFDTAAQQWRDILAETGFWHSFELPDGTTIRGAAPVRAMRERIAHFPIPQDLSGKRVLDVGAWDGWFSFEMERRGAEVVAVDNWDNPRFHQIHQRLGSCVQHRVLDVYELTPQRLGRFDFVLFMGVLHHLKHPLLALERVCALATDMAAVDCHVIGEGGHPVMAFYEREELGGNVDNWVAPNVPCLLALCRAAGFARVELRNVHQYESGPSAVAGCAGVACYRRWQDTISSACPAPELRRVYRVLPGVGADMGGINFDSHRDEYVSCCFRTAETDLCREDVYPQVGEYGAAVIVLRQLPSGTWVSFRLPPGLAPGWHEVRVRTRNSGFGNAIRIAVDIALTVQRVYIVGAADGISWRPEETRAGGYLSVWAGGLGDNCDIRNVQLRLTDSWLRVTFVGTADDNGWRQVNAVVPPQLPRGPHELVLLHGDAQSEPRRITVTQ